MMNGFKYLNSYRFNDAGKRRKSYGYHWSTMDLYSWINGYVKRYDWVRVDFEKQPTEDFQ